MENIGAKNNKHYIRYFFARNIDVLENEMNEYINDKGDKPISISYKSDQILGFCIAFIIFEKGE